MSAPPERREWDARLSRITAAQWMQAIAWRVVMRVLPLELRTPRVPSLLPRLSPTLLWTHAAMRLLYATIFCLDRDYRGRLGSAASEATIHAALATEPLIDELRWRSRLMEGSELPTVDRVLIPLSHPKMVAWAHRAIGSFHVQVIKFFPALTEAWEDELIADLEALEPLDREEFDDLQEFLVRPLWRASVTEFAGAAREWLAEMRGIEVAAVSAGLLDHYEQHLTTTLDWEGVCSLILEMDRRQLSPDAADALQHLANDPVRLAKLLAKAALDDRTRLKLTTDPSVAAFRGAFPEFDLDPATLVELDRRLETSHADFAPNPLWIAWIQTGPRRLGLDGIMAEIRSRLSPRPVSEPDPIEAPERSEPLG
ncbi:MAG TPA: hypothetical protein VIS96_11265 [Terrimicrobiaceae bacterium]